MLLLGGSLSLCAQSKYPPIEELVYTGYYNWGFIWVKAGRVDFSLTTSEKYPNAKIMEIDVEDDRNDWDFGYTEVDIIHNGISKDVLFDQTGDWHSTSWEVRQNELPEAVKNTINNQYGEYRFDEAKRIEKADGTIYYRIELEKMNVDLEVNINEDGIVIP